MQVGVFRERARVRVVESVGCFALGASACHYPFPVLFFLFVSRLFLVPGWHPQHVQFQRPIPRPTSAPSHPRLTLPPIPPLPAFRSLHSPLPSLPLPLPHSPPPYHPIPHSLQRPPLRSRSLASLKNQTTGTVFVTPGRSLPTSARPSSVPRTKNSVWRWHFLSALRRCGYSPCAGGRMRCADIG